MPFSYIRHHTGALESNGPGLAVTPPLSENMPGQNIAEAVSGNSAGAGRAARSGFLLPIPLAPRDAASALNDWPRIDEIRQAIKANRVNFPVPVPIFPAQFRPEIQWRLVELYFIRGWSTRQLAERYGVTARRIQQSIQQWTGLAVARGYLQVIPPEAPVMPSSVPAWMAAVTPDAARVETHFPPPPQVAAPEFAVMPPA